MFDFSASGCPSGPFLRRVFSFPIATGKFLVGLLLRPCFSPLPVLSLLAIYIFFPAPTLLKFHAFVNLSLVHSFFFFLLLCRLISPGPPPRPFASLALCRPFFKSPLSQFHLRIPFERVSFRTFHPIRHMLLPVPLMAFVVPSVLYAFWCLSA